MTREYEFVYIFDSALEEAQINEILERLHVPLKTPESPEPITEMSHWGKRTLAYEIKGKAVGYYVVVRCTTQPDALGEFERLVKLDESVLRYLVVINEGLGPLGATADTGVDQEGDNEAEARTAAPVIKLDVPEPEEKS